MKENRSLTGIIAVTLIIGVAAYLIAPSGDYVMGRGMGQHTNDLAIYYTAKAVLASMNAFLLIVLSSIYWKVYRDTGLEFSLGLVIFSVALLMYSLVSNPLLVSVAGYRASGLGPFAMLPDLFTCIASLTLLYISR
ncbi:MAG: hypothetical protein NWF07_08855 [Candidatus Bathyarchaeota archaeon]|nr:hypothetical protein [Candidatus Bathyarchaeota archaeon]